MDLHPLAFAINIFPAFSFISTLSVGAAVLLTFLLWYHLSLAAPHKLPYPPGPPAKDFISGNARDLLASRLWLTLTDWAAEYGGIMHLRAFNTHIIVLSSLDIATELMEKRSNNYSDRPYIPMIDLSGWTFNTAFKPYGPAWHAHRRRMQQMFRATASLEYRSIQVEKVNDMLHGFLGTPEDFLTHIKTLSASIIMEAMYGYKVAPQNDYFQSIAEAAMTSLSAATYPGAAIVNILPFLRFLPSWVPGMGFHRVAKLAKATTTRLQEDPYKYVEDNLASGTAKPSFVANFIETCTTEKDHAILKETAATGYGAGADTTTSALGTFLYAMATFPSVQRKAQEELDKVIGTDRAANYGDEQSLPYLQALLREVFRWKPVTPLGVFHSTTAEDVYNSHYIPKGTTIISNIWSMTRDPVNYKDPDEFNPDRFFDENNKLNDDDMSYTFGFGRRICPGRHLASATVWLAIATTLSTFDIALPKDRLGKDIPLTDIEYTGGLISHPLPFKCTITPRSNKTRQLIVDIHNSSI